MDEVIADSYTPKWIDPAEYAIDKIVCLQVTRLNYLLFRIPSACCRPQIMNPCTGPFSFHSPFSALTRDLLCNCRRVFCAPSILITSSNQPLSEVSDVAIFRNVNFHLVLSCHFRRQTAKKWRRRRRRPRRFLLHRDSPNVHC